MDIISVINYKGGVGKTTVTANLAAELAYRGYNVLAIDLDPQASLTFSFMGVDEWKDKYATNKTIKNWYDAFINDDSELDLKNLIVSSIAVNKRMDTGSVALICSNLALINVDLELATKLGGATLRQSKQNYLRVYSRLKQGLATLEEDRFDYILIDCPPNFNIVTKNALVASNYLLVPAKPDYLSTLGIDQLRRHVTELTNDYNDYARDGSGTQWQAISPEILGVLFTMISVYRQAPISTQQQYISQVQSLGVRTMKTFIRRNDTIYADAPEYGVPVVLKDAPDNTRLVIRNELEELATEFLEALS